MRPGRLKWTAVVVAAGLFLGGCGSSRLPPSAPSAPSAPSGGTSFPAQAPQATNPSSASVTIEDPFAVVNSAGPGNYGYWVGFLLRETSDRSGATIVRVVVYGPSGSDEYDYGTEIFSLPSGSVGRNACYDASDKMRVPAHGELDTFYTEAGAKWLSYCAPGTGGKIAEPILHVIVAFRDDSGVVGSVVSPISTLR
jgi:hypothetical protein